MLTMLEDKVSVGYYTNATKIVKMISGVLTSITAVLIQIQLLFCRENYEKIKEMDRDS
jgi:O-antigen/teichoic acid export membrane protein